MICTKQVVCRYFKKGKSIDEQQWLNDVNDFCENKDKYMECAIFMVIDGIGFVKCPLNLRPGQKDRAQFVLSEHRKSS